MSAEELALAVERHATGNSRADDLTHVATSLPREALPSIGAVGRPPSPAARRQRQRLTSGRGRAKGAVQRGAGPGTRVELRDLSTPRRHA
jgi:DNA mismatch repair ATPase MutL